MAITKIWLDAEEEHHETFFVDGKFMCEKCKEEEYPGTTEYQVDISTKET